MVYQDFLEYQVTAELVAILALVDIQEAEFLALVGSLVFQDTQGFLDTQENQVIQE